MNRKFQLMEFGALFRKAAEAPAEDKFYLLLTQKAKMFALQYFGERNTRDDFSLEEKTLAYLFLAAIAESEGL